jgi:hypothetical protein
MGQVASVTSVIEKTATGKFGVDMDAVNYLANLPSDEHSNIFSLRKEIIGFDCDPPITTFKYHHEFESSDYKKTFGKLMNSNQTNPWCILYIPFINENYCIFFDLTNTKYNTLGIINLADTTYGVFMSCNKIHELPLDSIIEIAESRFDIKRDKNKKDESKTKGAATEGATAESKPTEINTDGIKTAECSNAGTTAENTAAEGANNEDISTDHDSSSE